MANIPSGMHTTFLEEECLLYKDVLTNPYSFKMDSRTWCVGTYDGYKTYYHTDCSNFADFILSDGSIGRANLEWVEGGCSIDGNALEELFDNM